PTAFDQTPITSTSSTHITSQLSRAPSWEYILPQNIGEISSSPQVHGHHLYVAVNHPTLNFVTQQATMDCLDLKKDPSSENPVVWKFDDDGNLAQMFSSPRIADNRLYFGEGFHQDQGCRLFCLDALTGKPLWNFTTASHTESTPCIHDG